MAPHRPHFENSSGSPWTILWITVDASACSQIGQAAKLSNCHSRTGRAPHVRSAIGVGTSRAVTGDIPAKTFSRGRAFRGCVKMSTDWPHQSFRTSMPKHGHHSPRTSGLPSSITRIVQRIVALTQNLVTAGTDRVPQSSVLPAPRYAHPKIVSRMEKTSQSDAAEGLIGNGLPTAALDTG